MEEKSAYILIYKKTSSGVYFLINKNWLGIKIENNEQIIYCRRGRNPDSELFSYEELSSRIKLAKDLILKSKPYTNLRVHKNSSGSINFVSDDSHSFANFIGGKYFCDEDTFSCLARELKEELFLNIEKPECYIKDIISNIELTYNSMTTRSYIVGLINWDKLNDLTKKFISDAVDDPSILHKKVVHCGVPDVEIGEIKELLWIDYTTLKRKMRHAKYGEKAGELNKFNSSDILKKILDKIVDTSTISDEYYTKYIKYKNKYLTLKSK
jgi:hypothetical protein